ncbi:Pbn1p Ecym_1020 [Eremothecium cymbalariae DBVPG|uniref:Protein PBN1 n=1 Tax=Eremothecium cymbalariae (strain CBS 270.75 / DBVPG 7215 / KCTC 17166 / NRRL Y-17582) TaxID=931890 RepID=G8JM19_ERECY|nr:hypothetical protein Ecym_1020 [Eremothecium cymbalariae DBVPG\
MKVRKTVLFKSAELWAEQADRNETHITVRGTGAGGELVQSRTRYVRSEGGNTTGNVVRITWNHLNSDTASEISPQLLNGFNIYVSGDEMGSVPSYYVTTPLQRTFHSAKFELDAVRSWLGEGYSFIMESLKWSECDYDLIMDKELRVDEYCTLAANQTISFSSLDYASSDKNVDNNDFKLEGGLFYPEISDLEDVHLSGVRCSWLEDGSGLIDTCEKTYLFYEIAHSKEAREHVPIVLEETTGMHPTVNIDLSASTAHEPKCKYYAFINLPVEIFVDKFQQPPTLLFGEDDLEQPSYKLDTWGSEVVYTLVPGKVNTIKLHSRYVSPEKGGGQNTVFIYPYVFEACDTDSINVSANPFYSKNLGFEVYFTPDTKFNHLNNTKIPVSIPRANTESFSLIQYTTVICLIGSILYLFLVLFKKPYHN